MHVQSLKIWQPQTNLHSDHPVNILFTGLIKHDDYFKIILEDYDDNITEIVYNQLNGPMEYYVWSFRYTTEIGRFGLYNLEVDESGLHQKGKAYFFKMENSEYINWFDNQNPLFNSTTHPNLEHHVYITRDEVIEVLSDYAPLVKGNSQSFK